MKTAGTLSVLSATPGHKSGRSVGMCSIAFIFSLDVSELSPALCHARLIAFRFAIRLSTHEPLTLTTDIYIYIYTYIHTYIRACHVTLLWATLLSTFIRYFVVYEPNPSHCRTNFDIFLHAQRTLAPSYNKNSLQYHKNKVHMSLDLCANTRIIGLHIARFTCTWLCVTYRSNLTQNLYIQYYINPWKPHGNYMHLML
jgi:hypothetical protein